MIYSVLIPAQFFPTWYEFWHPLEGLGYQWHSGIEGNFGELALIVTLIAGLAKAIRVYRKHTECHEDSCSRHGKYVIEGGVRCCDLHHPALDERPHDQRGHVHGLHVAHLAHIDQLRARSSLLQ